MTITDNVVEDTKRIVDYSLNQTSYDSLDTKQGMKNYGRCTPYSSPSAMVQAVLMGYKVTEATAWLGKWLQIQQARGILMAQLPPNWDPVTDVIPGPLVFNLWSPMHLTTTGLADLAIHGPTELQSSAVSALAQLVQSVLSNTVWKYVHQEKDAPYFLSYGGRWRIGAGLIEFHTDMRRVAHAKSHQESLPIQAAHLTETLKGILLNAPLYDGPGAEHYGGDHLCLWMVGRAFVQIYRAIAVADGAPGVFTSSERDLLVQVGLLAHNVLAAYDGVPLTQGGVAYDVVPVSVWPCALTPAPETPVATFGSTPQWAYFWAKVMENVTTPYAEYLRSAASTLPLVRAFQTPNLTISASI